MKAIYLCFLALLITSVAAVSFNDSSTNFSQGAFNATYFNNSCQAVISNSTGGNYLNGTFYSRVFKASAALNYLQSFNFNAFEGEACQAPRTLGTGASLSLQFRGKNYSFGDTNLTVWLDLGDSSENESLANTSLDLSGNNRNAVLGNGTPNSYPETFSTPCVVGRCLNFSQNNFALINPSPFSNLTPLNFSVSFWQCGGGQNQAMVGFTQSSSSNTQMWIDGNASSLSVGVKIRNSTGTTTFTISGTSSIMNLSGNCNHIVVTKNGTGATKNINIYINGVLETVGNLNHAGVLGNMPTDQISIGAAVRNQGVAGQPTEFYRGRLDDLIIWNRTITPAEVQALYNRGNPTEPLRPESNWTDKSRLVLWLKFNEGAGNFTFDSSNNSYIGVLRNNSLTCADLSTVGCPQWISGLPTSRYALSFNQLDQNSSQVTVNVSRYNETETNQLTWMAWINVRSVPNVLPRIISRNRHYMTIQNASGNIRQGRLVMEIVNATDPNTYAFDWYADGVSNFTNADNQSQWTHVAFSLNSTNRSHASSVGQWFINGVAVNTTFVTQCAGCTVVGNISDAMAFNITIGGGNTREFNGSICSLKRA